MIRESRLTALERLAEPERKALRYNRDILLSAIPEIMEKTGQTYAEARASLALISSPEEKALMGDDWETNPITLEFLKKLRAPGGRRKMIEGLIERSAAALDVSFEDMIMLCCLEPKNSLESKLEFARIARDRGLSGVVLVFSSSESGHEETTI